MGIFKKKKKLKEVVFETTPNQNGFSLENQNGKKEDIRDIDIEDYLDDMFSSLNEYVILTSPKAYEHIRFVQACMIDDLVEVQISIEDDQGAHLYYKSCTKEECYRIFLDFYDQSFKPNMNEYKPVLF